ncbi:IclR family transcriptional regulator [Arthrobacter cavernae]|uniref:IclR family transcriptional regulator n=1 Tax=Arthrobacter cavernae TaxID=2817681 RepID=A0A939HG68_9MICC|nr:IclR family transcriptional regulator [Arthrobacter cavernae]MBO1267296.1 IclR family transcriptional regulator [Arthrobacter cavernae]
MTEQANVGEALDLTNKSVVKATHLLSELGRHPQGISATGLAQIVGITRPTAFRLLLSLEQAGFVDRSDGRYRLGWQVARLGRLADPYAGVVARIQPVLDAYAASLGETINFSMLRGETDYDVIAEASAGRFLNVATLYVGRSYPLHVSATGKLVLAELDDERIAEVLPETLEQFTGRSITSRRELLAEVHRVRKQGYSILDDELEDGLFAVACPARDADGELFGIVVLQGPTQRMKSSRLPHVIEQVRNAAAEIALALAGHVVVTATPEIH